MKEKPQVERQVVIQREGRAPLGINIVNTADINPRPGAIFKVVSDGVAAQHGILDSDVIASINGLQTESMTHAEVIAEMGRCGNTIDLVLLSGNFPHNMVAVAARTPVAAPRSGPLSPLWTDDVKPPGSATSVSPSLRTLVIARGNKQSLGMALTETAQGECCFRGLRILCVVFFLALDFLEPPLCSRLCRVAPVVTFPHPHHPH